MRLPTSSRILTTFSSRRPIPKRILCLMQRPDRRAIVAAKNTHSYLQVLGNGVDTGDTLPSVLLFFDSYRYIFNVGEGFQRYCFQHRLKLGKINDIFLTRMSTEAAGGLPGLYITLSDYGVQAPEAAVQFNVHGPLNLGKYLEAIRSFVGFRSHIMFGRDFGSKEGVGELGDVLVSNDQVDIRPILLLPQSTAKESFFLKQAEPPEAVIPVACYVCRLKDVRGKFLREKAIELGVKVGPDFAALVDGTSVVAKSGRVVHPHEVVTEPMRGPVVVLVDCPDRSYEASLFAAKGFEELFGKSDGPMVLVHLGPEEVVSRREYGKWMKQFGDKAEHIFVNQKAANASAVMRKAAEIQTKLNLVDDRYFPIPKIYPVEEPWSKRGVVMGRDLMKYHLKPMSKIGLDESQIPPDYDPAQVVDKLRDDPDVASAIDAYRSKRQEREQSPHQFGPEELEITFLGTGAAIPSKYRNVTGIYLDLFDRGSLLLDCGEGSYGQLIRRFGQDGAREALRKLKCIWISHIHADHHMGVPTILRACRKLVKSKEPLLVIGPSNLYPAMTRYRDLEELNFLYLLTEETLDEKPRRKQPRFETESSLQLFNRVKKQLQLKCVESFLVDHCPHAYGVSLQSESGWKVVFSGDTVPCAEVAENAKDATILIHEATFEETMKQEAHIKRHSTTRDAIDIGIKANAYRTILTHFSQRYPKIPVVSTDKEAGVCVAFDLMTVNLSDLEMLPETVAPCQGLFGEEQSDVDELVAESYIQQ